MKASKIQTRIRRKAHIRKRISGTEMKPRLVVFRSNNHIYAQLIDDETGRTLVSSSDDKVKSGKPTEKAQNVGENIAKLAQSAGIKAAVFDRNGYKYHGRVKSLADAARSAGLEF